MATTHGFELLREQDIPELKTKARLFRHVKTGTELMSLENDDENKLFGIAFRTPPTDSTGVAHILEHSVLCGSRKYPVKEPFVELLKGSLQTFLNAFTYPDKTCYPVASQNLQDFYNLIDVYLDAVFYPRITPYIFQQEGWHYEVDNLDDPLTFKGVVFNEMKGSYSSSDRVLAEYSQQSIFPDITYGLESGGHPKHIPDLTYDQFKRFHQNYYHPSNARIVFYGDDHSDERLRLVDDYLKDFELLEVDSAIPLQSHFDQPKRLARSYVVSQDADTRKKGMVTVNWLLSETTDPETNLAFRILQQILVGMPASPLRKALIDSGLGEDLTGVGLEDELRQMYFSTGLKGIDIEDVDKVEDLIFRTLTGLADEGIDPHTVEAAVNTVEFRLRENNTGSFPRGLLLMVRSLTTWLYDEDPLALLAFEVPLAAIKARLAEDGTYFEEMIRQHFLQNSHRTTVVLQPDPNLGEQQDAAEKERLAQARAAMSQADLEAVIADTAQLRQMQDTPDSPEALATIPILRLSDLDKENKTIPLAQLEHNGTRILYHDLFTNGITYLDVGFDLHALPQEYLPYVSLFGRALLEMGTTEEDFVTLSQRIGRKTGGIRPHNFTSVIKGTDASTAWLFLRGKAMQPQSDDLLAILHDVLLTAQLDNRERFRQIVLEEKAGHEAGMVPGGHRVVDMRLRAHFNEADWAAEQMGGVNYLLFLRQLANDIDANWPDVLESLEKIRGFLVNRSAMVFNVTLDGANWTSFEPKLSGFIDTLPAAPIKLAAWAPKHGPSFEGLTIPAPVNYVAKGADLYKLGYQFHGSAIVITNYLRSTWLWDRVRVHGGAYGAFCVFDHRSGGLTYLSYRDPNLLGTLDNYDQASQFLRQLDLNQAELTKGIIGAIGDLDAYQLPDAKGYTSMVRYLVGDSDEARQRMRDQILGTTPGHFKAFADMLDQVNDKGLVVVLGSQAGIEAANADRPGWLSVLKLL